jgi:hypothetical protein
LFVVNKGHPTLLAVHTRNVLASTTNGLLSLADGEDHASRSRSLTAMLNSAVVFSDALQQGARQAIKKVKVWIRCNLGDSPGKQIFNQMVGQKRKYEKWWNQLTVSKDHRRVTLKAYS